MEFNAQILSVTDKDQSDAASGLHILCLFFLVDSLMLSGGYSLLASCNGTRKFLLVICSCLFFVQ